ncbi:MULTISPECIES: nitrilase-related carbon-nitrogen hydrolase [unclassified Microbacterium]|uniref:nitrilase-related carbon-nitrogen hydrolase n=1 Tax=unclassified Microbacterium TaxID=2609290 RepID=UPI0025D3C869|nr:nitrilase-related carbon-nitrogen hydrolase [uncultured Microbacterium sp.]
MPTVSLLQIASPDDETTAERIVRVEEMLTQNPGADLYVLPELWNVGYFAFDRYEEGAESLNGPTAEMVRGVARRLGAWIHLGSIVERGRGGQLHNTAVLVDPQGRIAQVYRKIHVFGHDSLEAELLTPGDALSVVDSPVGRLASTTCYDLRFPGLWQQVSARGAETSVIPAAWPAARIEHWCLLTTSRAVEHQSWVLAANGCGTQRGVELGGRSRLVDPRGTVVIECDDAEQIVTADVDTGLTAATRSSFPVLADRLAEYAALSHASGAES